MFLCLGGGEQYLIPCHFWEEYKEENKEEGEAQPRPDGVERSKDVQTGEGVGGVVDVAQDFCLTDIMLYGGDNPRDLLVYCLQQTLNCFIYKLADILWYLRKGFVHQGESLICECCKSQIFIFSNSRSLQNVLKTILN